MPSHAIPAVYAPDAGMPGATFVLHVTSTEGAVLDVPVSVEVCSTTGWADPERHVVAIARGARRFAG